MSSVSTDYKYQLGYILDEFIKESRNNLEKKSKLISELINSIKEENENIISKSNQKY
jgi:hypothetical protein